MPRSASATPPWYFRARTVATTTATSGRSPDLRHLMSTNFSAPRSAPKPASVTTKSASRRPARVAITELHPWAMLANGPPCTNAGAPSRVCTRFGASASRSSAAIAPSAPSSRAVTGCRAARVADDDVADPLLEVAPRLGEAEDRHQLGGDDDVEAVLARVAVGEAAERHRHLAQRAVVHVEHALPGDAADVDVERVAVVDVVVDQRGEQVVRGGDRGEVAGEVQVDVGHRHDLAVAAAGRAALHPEHRAHRRLAQAGHRLLAQPVQRVGEADGGGGLALAGRRRRERRHQHQLARGAGRPGMAR